MPQGWHLAPRPTKCNSMALAMPAGGCDFPWPALHPPSPCPGKGHLIYKRWLFCPVPPVPRTGKSWGHPHLHPWGGQPEGKHNFPATEKSVTPGNVAAFLARARPCPNPPPGCAEPPMCYLSVQVFTSP